VVEDDDSVVANLIAAIEQDDDVFLGDLDGDEEEDNEEELEELMEQLSMLEDDVAPLEEGDAAAAAGGEGEDILDVGEDGGVEDEDETTVFNVEFPERLKGLKLGEITHRIRVGDVLVGHDPSRKAMLDSIGFDWGNQSKYINAPFSRVLAALYAYKKIRGDLCVERSFEVPEYDPWPTVLGGFELGHYVNELRGQKVLLQDEYPLKMQMLNQLDFLWLSKQK